MGSAHSLADPRASHSQAAKTYLERKFEDFAASSADELIKHGLQALSASVSDGELTQENCTVAIVGKGLPLVILEGDALKPHIDALKVRHIKYHTRGALIFNAELWRCLEATHQWA